MYYICLSNPIYFSLAHTCIREHILVLNRRVFIPAGQQSLSCLFADFTVFTIYQLSSVKWPHNALSEAVSANDTSSCDVNVADASLSLHFINLVCSYFPTGELILIPTSLCALSEQEAGSGTKKWNRRLPNQPARLTNDIREAHHLHRTKHQQKGK